MKEMILGTSNVSFTAKPNRVVKTVCIKSNLSSNPYANMEFEVDTLPQDYGYQFTHEIGNPVPIWLFKRQRVPQPFGEGFSKGKFEISYPYMETENLFLTAKNFLQQYQVYQIP